MHIGSVGDRERCAVGYGGGALSLGVGAGELEFAGVDLDQAGVGERQGTGDRGDSRPGRLAEGPAVVERGCCSAAVAERGIALNIEHAGVTDRGGGVEIEDPGICPYRSSLIGEVTGVQELGAGAGDRPGAAGREGPGSGEGASSEIKVLAVEAAGERHGPAGDTVESRAGE